MIDGKSVKISLLGSSTQNDQGRIAFSYPKITVPSIPLGLGFPIIIPINFENIAFKDAFYEFDYEVMKQNYQEEYKTGVIKVLNVAGFLKGKQKSSLIFYFRPVLNQIYKFDIPMKFWTESNQPKTIIQKLVIKTHAKNDSMGPCFSPLMSKSMMEDRIQGTQPDKNLAVLSDEIINFERIKLQKQKQAVMLLMNNSPDKYFEFSANDLEIVELVEKIRDHQHNPKQRKSSPRKKKVDHSPNQSEFASCLFRSRTEF